MDSIARPPQPSCTQCIMWLCVLAVVRLHLPRHAPSSHQHKICIVAEPDRTYARTYIPPGLRLTLLPSLTHSRNKPSERARAACAHSVWAGTTSLPPSQYKTCARLEPPPPTHPTPLQPPTPHTPPRRKRPAGLAAHHSTLTRTRLSRLLARTLSALAECGRPEEEEEEERGWMDGWKRAPRRPKML